jgi:hypothetical protein
MPAGRVPPAGASCRFHRCRSRESTKLLGQAKASTATAKGVSPKARAKAIKKLEEWITLSGRVVDQIRMRFAGEKIEGRSFPRPIVASGLTGAHPRILGTSGAGEAGSSLPEPPSGSRSLAPSTTRRHQTMGKWNKARLSPAPSALARKLRSEMYNNQ